MKPVLAIAIALAYGAVPAIAGAQTLQGLQSEIDALKAQLKQMQTAIPVQDTDAEMPRLEFARVREKADALDERIEVSGLKGLKISGFLDPTYIVNQRQHTSSAVFMKKFGDINRDGSAPGGAAAYAYDNGFFGTGMLRFEKEVEGGSKWVLELMPAKSYGDAAGFNLGSLVNQAYFTLPSGIGKDKFYFGQIGPWSGYEFQLPTQKKTITDNLFFDFTEPAAFITGIGYEHYIGVAWDFKATLGNLNNGRVSDRRAPALHWRADYIPGEYWGVGMSGVVGKTGATTNVRHIDLDAFYIRANWTIQGQIEAGRAKGMAFDGRDSSWTGLGGLVAYKFTPLLEGVVRMEHIRNGKNGGGTPNLLSGGACMSDFGPTPCGDYRNGFGPGIDNATGLIANPDQGSNRSALTLALNYGLTQNAVWKFEVRRDFASQNVFYDTSTRRYAKNNTLMGTSIVFGF